MVSSIENKVWKARTRTAKWKMTRKWSYWETNSGSLQSPSPNLKVQFFFFSRISTFHSFEIRVPSYRARQFNYAAKQSGMAVSKVVVTCIADLAFKYTGNKHHYRFAAQSFSAGTLLETAPYILIVWLQRVWRNVPYECIHLAVYISCFCLYLSVEQISLGFIISASVELK